jgi:hypothetical protein
MVYHINSHAASGSEAAMKAADSLLTPRRTVAIIEMESPIATWIPGVAEML